MVIGFSEPILIDKGDLTEDDLKITIKINNNEVKFNWKSAITTEFY